MNCICVFAAEPNGVCRFFVCVAKAVPIWQGNMANYRSKSMEVEMAPFDQEDFSKQTTELEYQKLTIKGKYIRYF